MGNWPVETIVLCVCCERKSSHRSWNVDPTDDEALIFFLDFLAQILVLGLL
jgi:hypothetical protein